MSPLTSDALAKLAARAPREPPPTISDVQYDASQMLDTITDELHAIGIELGHEKAGKNGSRFWPLTGGCPYSGDHDDGAFLVQYPSGYCLPLCHHDRCRGKKLADAPRVFARSLGIKPLNTGPTLVTGGNPVEPNRPRRDPNELDPGHLILDRVRAFLGRFVSYPTDHAHTAHTLWIAHTHLMDKSLRQ